MAKAKISMKKLSKPKKPALNAAQSKWDTYEKKIKEYNTQMSARNKEQERRKKIS